MGGSDGGGGGRGGSPGRSGRERTPVRERVPGGLRIRPLAEDDWPRVAALEAEVYAPAGLSEGREALESRGRASPATCFVLETGDRIAGYVLALPYPPSRYPDLERPEERSFTSSHLHLHDLVVADDLRGRGLGSRLVRHLTAAARQGYEEVSLVAVGGTESFWARHGFRPDRRVELPASYGENAVYMSGPVPGGRPDGPETEG
ncbi:GNAT family N-acetyltransferase [Streptomyces hirsutus]|uniref:GNAT family N-acetyltransferase n=1 Tax=Streptomyces hirsutus TaxID=35620 RepID=UPI0033211375